MLGDILEGSLNDDGEKWVEVNKEAISYLTKRSKQPLRTTNLFAAAL
jgi:hypothetical protein